MLIPKAFKFELMSNGAQSRKLKQFCDFSNTKRNFPMDYSGSLCIARVYGE